MVASVLIFFKHRIPFFTVKCKVIDCLICNSICNYYSVKNGQGSFILTHKEKESGEYSDVRHWQIVDSDKAGTES